jgi:outer membrane protein OmpA-like peptidoglycan-associated protein
MTDHNPVRTPERQSARNRWHAVVAAVLAALLLLLWFGGKGPGSPFANGACCTAPAVTAPTAIVPAPAVAAADGDADGVADGTDRCPDTPAGERVGPFGCSCDVTVQLQYELDSAVLTADDQVRLDGAAQRLVALQFETGEVAGYADSTGDEQYNLELSQRRAQSARDYLVAKGVGGERLTAVGYGEANPIADNATPEGRALNRRAVIRRSDCPAPSAAASGATP